MENTCFFKGNLRKFEKFQDQKPSTGMSFFLEMMKYVSFLGSQTLVFFGPILTLFINSDPYYKMAELMEDKNNVELLMLEIETLEAEKKANNG